MSLKTQHQGYCQVCYVKFKSAGKDSEPDCLSCGHEFCVDDWRAYISQKVNEGF